MKDFTEVHFKIGDGKVIAIRYPKESGMAIDKDDLCGEGGEEDKRKRLWPVHSRVQIPSLTPLRHYREVTY